MRAALAQASRHGLNAEPYLRGIADGSDAALTRTALAYAHALAFGVIDPRDVQSIYTLTGPNFDLRSALAVALASRSVGTRLAGLPPHDPGYRALSLAYIEQLRAVADQLMEPDIPSGPAVAPGEEDTRWPAIRQQLVRRGYAPNERQGQAEGLAAAVRRFQAAAGLDDDGIIGPATLDELNQGPRDRVRQLAVNLERRRWLARRPPGTRIDVNIAAAEITYLRGGDVAWRGRAVVGAPGHETPWLGETFQDLVLHPPWRVPDSIARAEILPRGPNYLRRRGMRVVDGHVVQAAGPGAALGQVKFDMRNPYAIYLHDTPAKALFHEPQRHRSHGCVRVEGAVSRARRLAEDGGSLAAFDAALKGGVTREVRRAAPIPVRLLYLTATPDPTGGIRYLADAYGWDARLADRMGLVPGRLRAPLPVLTDLEGP
ncbi:MAG TPA: L,D-transpeptidase family protein [Phenylobacterium sp.]